MKDIFVRFKGTEIVSKLVGISDKGDSVGTIIHVQYHDYEYNEQLPFHAWDGRDVELISEETYKQSIDMVNIKDHQKLVEEAKCAIGRVYGDNSVEHQLILESLEKLTNQLKYEKSSIQEKINYRPGWMDVKDEDEEDE